MLPDWDTSPNSRFFRADVGNEMIRHGTELAQSGKLMTAAWTASATDPEKAGVGVELLTPALWLLSFGVQPSGCPTR